MPDPSADDEAARLLEEKPHSVRANVLLGEQHVAKGDDQTAAYYYRRAVHLAEMQDLSDAAVDAAGDALATVQARMDARREATLTTRGLPPSKRSPRLTEALDIAAGRRRRFVQEPTAFTYPGLPAIQFFDPAQFDWVPTIEAAAPAIRAELDALLSAGTDDFRAYVQHQTVTPEANKALLGKKDWSILPLCENGWLMPTVIEKCPVTWETVLKLPLPRISGWGPTVVFSLLKAGAHIAPHSGMFNTRLICHLPLIVPDGCRFRVGNEVREWEEGKLMTFDDTIEHEAWNDSEEDRVVLIFDVWRPELSEQERFELTALFSD
ncbi:MAG: aspartyl/asparaginyl beta-hydroxylase domain-containing protein [Sphingomonas sp.]|nr:aspartyl/asparaginyl beta-hydroxylase domain-containing protein [Sphingomonas sp.]